jgi:MarR family transcriptional regulator, transcriptional regulator for hemolysin
MDTPFIDTTLIDDITSLTRRMRTVFDKIAKEKGMTLARARILRLLKKSGAGATQSALATELEIEGPTLVRLLDNLEGLGWIARQAVEGDRRAKQIVLTDEGTRQADEVDLIARDFRGVLFRDIDPADMAVAVKVIRHISANMEDEP